MLYSMLHAIEIFSSGQSVRGGTTVLNLNLLSDQRNVSLRSPI
jgi:hypothetical protein